MRLALPFLAAASLVAAEPATPSAPKGWDYEADLDLSGRSGSASGSGLSGGAKAGYEDGAEKLAFSVRLNRLTSDGQTSADDLHVVASSERTLSESVFWYVRGDVGYDNARSLDFVSVAAGGYGRRLMQDARGSLSARVGLGHRHEESALVVGTDVNAFAGDLGLTFDRDLDWARLKIELSLVPALEDLSDIYARNEVSLEFLGKDSPLTLRLGLLQDYRSRETANLGRLDSTYFLRVVYKWK